MVTVIDEREQAYRTGSDAKIFGEALRRGEPKATGTKRRTEGAQVTRKVVRYGNKKMAPPLAVAEEQVLRLGPGKLGQQAQRFLDCHHCSVLVPHSGDALIAQKCVEFHQLCRPAGGTPMTRGPIR